MLDLLGFMVGLIQSTEMGLYGRLCFGAASIKRLFVIIGNDGLQKVSFIRSFWWIFKNVYF